MDIKDIQVILVVDNYYDYKEFIPENGEIIIEDEKLAYILIHSNIKLFSIPNDENYEDVFFDVKRKWYLGDGRFFINVLFST